MCDMALAAGSDLFVIGQECGGNPSLAACSEPACPEVCCDCVRTLTFYILLCTYTVRRTLTLSYSIPLLTRVGERPASTLC